ncbi:restriction endonuclease subunit S [Shinella sp. JR1-6]|uniref:restriction endonuclease subunit S n=1 Tax=Shinella sp. JR1-6 TaxID=2527671 RepID=UPI00102D519A|nr:restriction endonuclease subunit S [Shinella sp. JR1-6]TAA65095.1 restriction endonuclease subunit S [Shinella sp. JR1-6]
MSEALEELKAENPSAYPPSIQAGIPKLGDTPKGWTRYRLGNLLHKVERPAKLVGTQTYQLVTAKRNRGGIVAREVLRGNQIKTKTQFYVEAGDFLISNRQISHGACGVVPASLHRAVVSNEYTAFQTAAALDPEFLNALSHSIYFQQTCFHSSIGVHVEKLVFRLEDWMGWEFDIPPLEEQRRIVALLRAWDETIEQTERLIAAKRRRKMALFQKLFSNLPKRPLLEAADVWFSGVDKKSRADETPILLCNYMDVFHNSRITSQIDFMRATASKSQIADNSLRKHDVVFTKDSETSEEIAEPAVVDEDIPNLVCGYHLAIARPWDGVGHGPFIAQAMRHQAIRWQFSRLANGVVRFGLTLEAIEQAELFLPSLPVQERIAAVLDAEDLMIEGLLKQAKILRVQQRGLMQKVLTGERQLDERFDDFAPSILASAVRHA